MSGKDIMARLDAELSSHTALTEPDRLTLQSKVAFLTQPESYPERPVRVSPIETHMSWVFLTDRYAYKLKKPVRHDYLNFSTLEARRHDCEEELRLNRRLAPDVYLATVPLTRMPAVGFELDGRGEVVDWLVMMRRLPQERMLDVLIRQGRATTQQAQAIVSVLVDFYRREPSEQICPSEYRQRLMCEVEENARQLMLGQFQLAYAQIDAILRAQQEALQLKAPLFEARARDGRILEGHGDLRPEHICLDPMPIMIDCLEFKREFRVLDTADELAFLAMECERLGDAKVARQLLGAYRHSGFDDPPDALIGFYKSYRACLRAKLAVWHLREPHCVNPSKWVGVAQTYLDLAERSAQKLN